MEPPNKKVKIESYKLININIRKHESNTKENEEGVQKVAIQLLNNYKNANDYLDKVIKLIRDSLNQCHLFQADPTINISNNILKSQEVVKLLNHLRHLIGSKVVARVLRLTNKDYWTILHMFARFGSIEELIAFIKWFTSFDRNLAKEMISYTDVTQKNILHLICEFGAEGATEQFLKCLDKVFEDQYSIRKLMKAKAYSVPKRGHFPHRKPKVIYDYTPLRLLVFNGNKGLVSLSELTSLLEWLKEHLDYQFVCELLCAEDSDCMNILHIFARFSEDVTELLEFQDWIQRDHRFDFLRRFLTYQNKLGQGVLYFQARASKQAPNCTISFLNWMLTRFNKNVVTEVLHQTLPDNKNALLSIMAHPECMVKMHKVLQWCVSSLYPVVLRSMLPGLNEILLENVCTQPDLEGFLKLLDFLQKKVKPKEFCDFASVEDKNRFNFLMAISKHSGTSVSVVKFMRILVRGVPVKNILKYLMLTDLEDNTFLHHLFQNVSTFKELIPSLNHLVTMTNLDLMEDLLASRNNCGLTPLIMLVYNENPGNIEALTELCLWIISQMGPDFFIKISTEATKCGWNMFDFLARFKDDVDIFIELFKCLKSECGPACLNKIIQKPDEQNKSWTMLHLMFRYNSSEENLKKFLRWLSENVDMKFFAQSMILMRGAAPIGLLAKNSQLCLTNILESLEKSINVKFALDLIFIYLEKNNRSVLHALLENDRSVEEVKKFLDWLLPRSPMLIRALLLHRDRKGKTALDIADSKQEDLKTIILKFMSEDSVITNIKIEIKTEEP